MKVIIILIIIIAIFLVFKIVYISDFGESSLDMTDEEYEEACKEYNKHWEEIRRKELRDGGE